ncbi:MAG TPA: hemoglobin [Chitinophagaceae bacterium]|jgi:hemoglobin-like flavoprotein|nr:hemoglobin [Chitinophagaceae bacterium]
MTPRQISLVKTSWKLLREVDPELLGEVFYSRLFMNMPAARNMFSINMQEQYGKLLDMLHAVVTRLDRLEEITEEVRQLAIRHVHYGVKPEHYAYVGDALLWTLAKGLGKDWNKDTEEAWTNCYQLLSSTMIEAASQQ